MIIDRQLWASFTKWIQNPDNKNEIKSWKKHLESLYPEMKNDPDWLLKKYRKW